MSLQTVINATPFKTQVIMSATNPAIPIVLVEGKDDKKLLKSFFSDSVLTLCPENAENNKGEILNCLNFIQSDPSHAKKTKRIIGIIDADFNRIQNRLSPLSNLFYTDKHDMDGQIFASNAFNKFFTICFYDNQEIKFDSFCAATQKRCAEIAQKFGFFRLTLEEMKLYRIKKEIEIEDTIDANLNFDFELLKDNLIRLENEGTISSNKLKAIIEKIQKIDEICASKEHDPYQYANGHDLLIVLSKYVLSKNFKLKKANLNYKLLDIIRKDQKSRLEFIKELENYMRLAYELRWFKKSELYKKIKEFEGLEFLKILEIE